MRTKHIMPFFRLLVSGTAIFSILFTNIQQVYSNNIVTKPVDSPKTQPLENTTEPKPFLNAMPDITLGGLDTAPVGSNVSFTVSFKNNDADTGYGPYIDLLLDTTGPDGVYPGTTAGVDTYDGLGENTISASYLGIPFVLNSTMWVIELDENGQASHPLVRDTSGNPVVVTAPANFHQGDQLVVIRLPFGSFVNTQPAAVVDVTVDMSDLADIDTDLYVSARGGFQYGLTELDDWCCDLVVETISPWNTDSVVPTLFELTKTYSGPEAEAAAGPNFRTFYPMRYTVTATIAPGQSMTNLVLTDVIPSELQSYSLVSSSPAGASCSTLPSSPGGTVVCDWGSTPISGSATMVFDFYIPQGVVPATTGSSVASCNNASASAYWDSPDARDLDQTISENPVDCEHTLQDRSIAVQKGVTVQGGGDPAPGKVLVYTLNFQISDYFAFNNISLVDVLSDGQHFDPSYTPTLTVIEHGNTSTDVMDAANYTVDTSEIGDDTDPATDGTTTVTFDISDELIDRSLDGLLLGGCVPSGGGIDTDCDPINDGATSGTIVFQAIVQEEFTDTYPSGDESVDQGDELNNTVTVSGGVLNTSDLLPTGSTATDGSATTVSIGYGNLNKSILAITNGNTGAVEMNPSSVRVKPGDLVTFQLDYSLPTSDFEDLVITDYLPLPVFDADEVTSFTNSTCNDLASGVPAAGKACLGTGDTYHSLSGAVSPALSVDSAGNSIIWNYGDYDSTNNPTSNIELVFTVTVTDDPFADGLYLTNQANAVETSTQSNSSDANSIVQIQLTEPVLVSTKGIVATDNTNPTVTFSPNPPAPFTFTVPGSSGARWSGVINSTNLGTTPIDSNISGVDAGDLVTFAIVIQNNGSSINGAFDITIKDYMDTDAFTYPTIGNASSINLRVSYGDSTQAAINYTQPDGDPATAADLFSDGIQLVDPSGAGVCQVYDPNSGTNVIIITYDLRVAADIEPGTYTNTGAILNYSGSEGGTDFANPNLEDDAQVTTAVMVVDKTLSGTELTSTYNSATQGVIGELVNYLVVITVPEGVIPNLTMTDVLDSGMAFVRCTSIAASTGLETNQSGTYSTDFALLCPTTPELPSINPTISGDARTIGFNLGSIRNNDTANGTAETITIGYQAVVTNIPANQSGQTLNNQVTVSSGATTDISDSADLVTVIEPAPTVSKAATIAGGSVGLPGDPVIYTITIANATGTDAYDATISDPLPQAVNSSLPNRSLIYLSNPLTALTVTDSASTLTASDFTFSGSNADGWTLTSNSTFNLPIGRTITLTINGTLVNDGTPAVSANQLISNTANLSWTSLSGLSETQRSVYSTDAMERDGTDGIGGLNDYTTSDNGDILVTDITVTKQLIDSAGNVISGQSVRVGDVIYYRNTITIPRDTFLTGLTFADTMDSGLAFVACRTITAEVGLTTTITDGFDCANPTTSITGSGTSGGRYVNISFGDVQNTDMASARTVVVEYSVVVLDTDAVNRGGLLNNAVSVAFSVNGGSHTRTASAPNVTVTEPTITVSKTASPDTGDAGDTISFTIVVSASTGTNYGTAYDVTMSDTLPSGYTYVPGSVSTSSGVVPTTGPTYSAGTITAGWASLAPGDTTTFTYSAVLDTTVIPDQVITNSAAVTYTSLPGTPLQISTVNNYSFERTGDSTLMGSTSGSFPQNDYLANASESVTVNPSEMGKVLTATSESTTSGNYLSIGETATFTLTVTLPEGTTPSLTVTDLIPTGIAYVAGSYSIDTTGFNGTLPVPTVTAAGGNGDDLILSFGEITVADDGVLTNNSFTVQLQAVVLNVIGNQRPNSLVNQASVQVGSGTVRYSPQVTMTVVEPVITMTKTIVSTPSPLDAGGVVHYRITYANGTGATVSTALDVSITDALASALLLPSTGAPDLVITTSGSVGTITNNSTTSNINLIIASVAPGGSVTVDFYPVIQDTITIGQVVNNSGISTWTSLTGTVSGERTGTGGVNDYTLTRTVPFTASSTIGLVKSIYATSEATTSGTDLAIGETVTYNILLTFPEGTTPADTVVDDLPTGLQLVSGSPQIIFLAAGSGSALAADFGGSIGTAGITTDTSDGGSVQFSFSNVVTAGDNDTTNNSILLQFQAQVTNILANQAGTAISNTASNQVGTNTPTNSNTVTVTVVEPVITFTKTIVSTPSPLDAGGVVHYQISYANGTGATVSTALDVSITDALASALLLPSTGAPDLVITTSGSVGAITNNSTTSNINLSIASVAPGASVTVDFYPVIQSSITIGEVVNNEGVSTWTSLTGTVSGERTGAGGVNDYTTDDIVTFTNSDEITIAKSIATTSETGTSGTDVAVGEIVTYNIILTFPEGTTLTDMVVDDLPAGLQLVSGSPQIIFLAAGSGSALAADFGGSIGTAGITTDTSDGGSVQFSFSNVVTAGDNDTTNNSILLQFQAQVTNILANQAGTAISNTASNQVGTNTPTNSNTVTVTVVEPVINITKTVDDNTPAYSQLLTFTISLEHDAASTSGAYDLVVTDTVPSELLYVAGSMTAPTGWTIDESAAPTLTWQCLSTNACSIPTGSPTINLGYQATVVPPGGSVAPGDSITNTAGITWTSLSTVSSDERTGTGGVNDYINSSVNNMTLSYPDLSVTKDDGVTAYVPGGSVTYTIVVSNSGNIADSGSLVSDPIPPEVTSWTWTCVEAGGADGCDGVTNSTTNFTDTVNLPVGSTITYTVTANLNSAAASMTDPNLVNTVTVAVSGGRTDATPDNNTATDTDTPDSQADLWTTKTDHISLYAPPATLTYTIVVGNDGPSDAPGSEVTDIKPIQFASWDWECTTLTGGAGACSEQTNLTGDFTDTVDLPAGATITYTVTARLTAEALGTLINSVVIDPPTLVTDTNPTNNTATDIDQPAAGAKTFNGTNQTFTSGQSVAIGEIVTYRVVLDVAGMTGEDPTIIDGLHLVDTLDQGLAYVDCVSITATDESLHPVSGDFANICANPTVEAEPSGNSDRVNAGRKVTWNFGSIENNGESAQTLVVEYRAVVLDAQGVSRGSTLNNSAVWTWQGGEITSSAVDVTVVEPTLTLTKAANVTVLINGATVTYTLTVGYHSSSNIEGYDVILTDIIPEGLTYVPGSLVISSGYSDGATVINEGSAPTLHVTWPTFPSGSQAVIQYQVTVGVLPLGREYTNTANVSWTSLPGDYSSPQSSHNLLSVERFYDPTSSVDIYGVQADLTLPTPGIPATGFAPGKITRVGIQPAEKEYTLLSDMVLEIPSLGIKLPITGIPFADDEWDLTWLADQAGYLQGTAFPTHAGNSVITAHVYQPDGKAGPFVDLNTLKYGDQIIIHGFGQKYTYEVRSTRQISTNDQTVFAREAYPVITLLTCQGYNDASGEYNWRYLVRAVQVKVEDE